MSLVCAKEPCMVRPHQYTDVMMSDVSCGCGVSIIMSASVMRSASLSHASNVESSQTHPRF